MADNTAIEWTDATWNPVTGCTKISAGCDHCYAETLAERFRGKHGHYFENGFDLTLRPDKLTLPLRWKRPRRIFVNSMSDLFHKEIPKAYIDAVFDTMEKAHWHTYQVLTKRSSLLQKFINDRYGGRPAPQHIWLGVSVEDEKAETRIAHLQEVNAGIRFLSIEPLIAPVGKLNLFGIDWVIVGGESGPGARPMHPDWVRDIRDQCQAAGVPFFFKQHGEWREFGHNDTTEEVEVGSEVADAIAAGAINPSWIAADGRFFSRQRDLPEGLPCRLIERIGKKRAGAEIDGREWREFPTTMKGHDNAV